MYKKNQAVPFYLCVFAFFTDKHFTEACGDLKAAKTEVIEGQTLQLEFSSSSHRFNTPDILLLRDKTDLTSQTEMFNRNLEDTEQRAKEFRDGSKFIYTITAVSKAQSGQYIVRCENGGYSNYATVTVISSAKKLNKEPCGNLSIFGQNNQTVGAIIQLLFLYDDDRISNVDWEHLINGTFVRVNKDQRGKYEETESDNIYVLKISESRKSDAGMYRVNCGGHLYSNTVEVLVAVIPPGKPKLSPLTSFPECSKCIKAVPGRWAKITCECQNGSRPLAVTLFRDGKQIERSSMLNYMNSSNAIKVTYDFLGSESLNWAALTCKTINDALTVPYTTSTRIYVYRQPDNPDIRYNGNKEGSKTLIECISHGGRPAPKIKYILNNTFEEFPMTVNFNDLDKTFNAQSSFQRVFSRHDNKYPVRCCVKHELVNGKIKCTKITLDIKFPPVDIQLEEVSRSLKLKKSTKISLLCTTGVSNPISNITWDGLDDIENILLTTESKEKEFGGYQLSQLMSIDVSRQHFGREIGCRAENFEFPDLSISMIYKVNITYQPHVTINEGSELIVGVGHDIRLTCTVDSNPPANISWSRENATSLNQGLLNERENFLFLHAVDKGDSGVYICSAMNKRGFHAQYISLLVNDSLVPSKNTLETDTSDTGGVVAGVVVAVILVAAIVIVVLYMMKKRQQDKLPKVDVVFQSDRRNEVDHQVEDPVYNNIGSSNEFEPAEYASVIPKSQRVNQQPKTINSEELEREPTKAPTKELVYAELDLQSADESPAIHSPQTEQIEYVELDFKKTAEQSSEQSMEQS